MTTSPTYRSVSRGYGKRDWIRYAGTYSSNRNVARHPYPPSAEMAVGLPQQPEVTVSWIFRGEGGWVA